MYQKTTIQRLQAQIHELSAKLPFVLSPGISAWQDPVFNCINVNANVKCIYFLYVCVYIHTHIHIYIYAYICIFIYILDKTLSQPYLNRK